MSAFLVAHRGYVPDVGVMSGRLSRRRNPKPRLDQGQRATMDLWFKNFWILGLHFLVLDYIGACEWVIGSSFEEGDDGEFRKRVKLCHGYVDDAYVKRVFCRKIKPGVYCEQHRGRLCEDLCCITCDGCSNGFAIDGGLWVRQSHVHFYTQTIRFCNSQCLVQYLRGNKTTASVACRTVQCDHCTRCNSCLKFYHNRMYRVTTYANRDMIYHGMLDRCSACVLSEYRIVIDLTVDEPMLPPPAKRIRGLDEDDH
jgi:hypothetical protein